MVRKLTPNEIKQRGNSGHHSKAEIARRKKPFVIASKPAKPDDVVAPDDLDEIGAKKYRELVGAKVFDNVESAEHYARLFSQKAAADADIAKNGMSIEGERGSKANPAVRLSSDLARELTKMLNQRNKIQAGENPALALISGAIERMKATK